MNYLWMTVGGIALPFILATFGALLVYCFKNDLSPHGKTLIFGLSSGVMLAASIWSLFLPAITEAKVLWQRWAAISVALAFCLGILFVLFIDYIDKYKNRVNFFTQEKRRTHKLFCAMTLHNFPEGLAVGLAFGAASAANSLSAYFTALGLAFGVGVQNFPESLAMALPMKDLLKSRNKAFFYTLFSCALEPICAIVGYFFAAYIRVAQPCLLAFSAGAMLYIVFDELLPECLEEKTGKGTIIVLFAFLLMTLLEIH